MINVLLCVETGMTFTKKASTSTRVGEKIGEREGERNEQSKNPKKLCILSNVCEWVSTEPK